MDKDYIVEQLVKLATEYNIPAEREVLGELIAMSSFRVITKGALIASVGDDTEYGGLMLNGLARSYYIDSDGNDITRGFAVEGSLLMDEGFFGYEERMCMWEALEDSTIMLCETSKVRELIHSNATFKDLWIVILESSVRYKLYRENGFLVENATEKVVESLPLTTTKIWLRIDGNFVPRTDIATFYYSLDGENWQKIGNDYRLRFDWNSLRACSHSLLHLPKTMDITEQKQSNL